MNFTLRSSFLLLLCTICVLVDNIDAQQKQLTESEYVSWNRIRNVEISASGDWSLYTLQPNKGDATLKVHHHSTGNELSFERAKEPSFDYSGNWLYFLRTAAADTIIALKRKGIKEKDMPHDTLVIVNLNTREVDQSPHVKSYKLPKKVGNSICYLLEPEKWSKNDSTKIDIKKQTEDNGSNLVMRDLLRNNLDTISYVTQYELAEENAIVIAHTTGESDSLQSLIRFDIVKNKRDSIHTQKGKYDQISISKNGNYISYIADFDTTKTQIRPHEIFLWKEGSKSKKLHFDTRGFPQYELKISEHYRPMFSENGQRMYYGVATPPIVQDTSLLEEEIVKVEVWSYHDPKLYSQQESEQKETEKQHFTVSYDLNYDKHSLLNYADTPNLTLGNRGNATFAISSHTESYEQSISWIGYALKDLYKIDVNTGRKTSIIKKTQGSPSLSPEGKYAYWYSRPDSSWYAYDLFKDKMIILADSKSLPTYDESNDRPMEARSYGIAGWTKGDKSIVLYDRYDLIEVSIDSKPTYIKWTNGRKDNIIYRYHSMDPELRYIPRDSTLLLSVFDEKDKSSGYAHLHPESRNLNTIIKEPFQYDLRPIKARLSNDMIITKESFELFPDLLWTNTSLSSPTKISNANPQQKEYRWGSAEIYKWTDENGRQLEGLLIKPDGFNPKKKYPMMVNFYERNSNNLHRHRAPDPHRSTINYSMYTNKGFVIFNPDIWYTDGHPGESCRKSVVSGVESLIKKGYIDKNKIGVQGHSWGGYQIAYLLSKTNIFACAEAGAPVVNMTSAYGGIRWRSGMSRMFQYEQTQSRIGATLWEAPDLYIENSPIFDIPKVETPVLILHNDKDGAVPWYQGIEYFVALRRLGKPAWMLNYNGEPHWPVKWQNRMDFQKRMAQFFDHYLLGEPMPSWMKNGVKANEKGINQGYELD